MATDRSPGGKDARLPPITPRPVHRPTPEEVDRHGDEIFQKSIADLSRRLGERAQQQSTDPSAEAERRRAALLAYNATRTRRLRWIAGASGTALAAATIAWLVVAIGAPPPDEAAHAGAAAPPGTKIETASLPSKAELALPTAPTTTPMTTTVEPTTVEPTPDAPADLASASPAEVAKSAPASVPPSAPSPPPPPISTASQASPPPPASAPPEAAPSMTSSAAPPVTSPAAPAVTPSAVPQAASAPAPDQTPLQTTEIREVQTRLYTYGFNPGPIDGAPGALTADAAMRYRADRGLPPNSAVNRTLLETLRQDPAPQVAQAPPPSPPRPAPRAYAQRRSDDPFESLRIAGDRFGRWLQSLGR
ncbi:MAG: hypothetical protein JSR91_04555 [Proteobacteria bacterium]|nr:hypothetical protein [Pseudomonadota bacterium]